MDNNFALNNSILIVTGMHRSGTSLVASILQSAGMDLGKHLMPGTAANPHGYFENLEFVNFHREILESQALSSDGWVSNGGLEVPITFQERAKLLLDHNGHSEAKVWGWKDPRSVIFLKFWANALPSAKFLFVHRSPWEVIDSLYRRGDIVFQKNPKLALTVWQNFNELILDFCRQFSERSIMFGINSIIKSPGTFIERIQDKFALELTAPAPDRYDSKFFHKHSALSYHAQVIKTFFPESFRTWQELERESAIEAEPEIVHESDERQERLAEAILQNWWELRSAQNLLQKGFSVDVAESNQETAVYPADQPLQPEPIVI